MSDFAVRVRFLMEPGKQEKEMKTLQSVDWKSAVKSGLIATGLMTFLMVLLGTVGMAKMMGTLLLGASAGAAAQWTVGMIIHILIGLSYGIAFAVLVAFVPKPKVQVLGPLFGILLVIPMVYASGPFMNTLAAIGGNGDAMVGNPCNPCGGGAAVKNPCNPCGEEMKANGHNPCNPCNKKKADNPCNPCNKKKADNPCNPCSKKQAKNPCNPCAKKAQNPCGPGNPCGGEGGGGFPWQAALTHLIFGLGLGLTYRSRNV